MEQRTLILADGRKLSWIECGDPGGRPVLYCHGFPSSGREALFADAEARGQGIRLVAPDRPGYGGSDLHPGRRIGDWPDDAAALLDHLDIDRAPILAMSGGAPYGLACVARLPMRFNAVVTVSGLGPLWRPEARQGMSAFSRLAGWLAVRWPALQAGLFHVIGGVLRLHPNALFGLIAAGLPAADRQVFRDRELRAIWQAALRAGLRQGARGAIDELRLFGLPWGFELDDLHAPVRIWHGDADTIVPPAHAGMLATTIPGAETRLHPGEGHFSLAVAHVRQILDDVVDAAR